MPKDWSVEPLGRWFRERKTTVSDADFAPLSVTMQGIVPQLDNVAKTDNNANRKLVLAGDFAINSRSDRKGSAGVSGLDGSVSVITTVLQPCGLNARFSHHLLRSRPFQEEFYRWGHGIVDDLWSTKWSDMKSIKIPVPPEPEQRAIADYLDRETAQIDAFIAKNEELITLLTERRSAEIELAVAPRELPATWDSVQIRRLGPKSQSGVSVNGFSVPAEGDEIGVLKTGAVSKGFFDPAENKRVVPEDLGRVAAAVRGGSLIVNRANTPELVGSAALVAENHPTLYLSDKLWQVTFESANAAYMHYWTKTDAYRSQLRGMSVGASLSMQNLSYGDFLSVRVSVPPMREQAELVARLDQALGEINRAIDAARRGSNLAGERRAALIAAAVTGKINVGVKL
ncbi:hypothetical protein ACL00U_16790 [Curtobacterium poinsettiae]|uniref:hypothetical protein n=1 Tax=Curtobacterium poinsettiae TaxID=159612 RepID=UPI0039A24BC5